jgi:hypothetical protein
MSRVNDAFHALKVIRGIVNATQESIDAAIADPARTRAFIDQLRDGSLGADAKPKDLESFVETITLSVRQWHAISHLAISELETMGRALENIRQELELVGIEPRTKNLGEGARGTKPTDKDKPS